MTRVYLDIGSNIGRRKNIQSCVDQLQDKFSGIVFSNAYESPAFGFDGEPFINISAGFDTKIEYHELKAYLKKLEDKHARKRDNKKFISRTLDIDVLLFGKLILQPEIDVPRAEILKFPFVLFPLAEIASNAIHPIENKTIVEIVKQSTLDKTLLTLVENFPQIQKTKS